MSTTDVARLRARGRPITLIPDAEGNERTATLVYDFESLETLEEEFGSLGALQNLVQVDDQGVPVGSAFKPLRLFIGAGLLHQGISLEDSKRLLDPARLSEYFSAAREALEEALPRAEGKGKAAKKNKSNGASNGRSSSTSPQSDSAEPASSSGE